MELKVVNDSGAVVGALDVSDALFARDYNEDLVHQIITAYRANGRSGNRAQKGRSEIAKSTRKPFRQKGTGRARAGMASSPIWRGGGKIFPNSPEENFTQKVNRKMYRAGVAVILSQLVREERLVVLDTLAVDAPKTKIFAGKLKSLGLDSALFVADQIDENLFLSSRNVANALVLEVREADPVSLVKYDKVVLTRDAVKRFEELLA
ncbi:50S ribosomal protein L4 [Leeia sp. TBRC 13508]|uniref:Large ribosomal subunit protein uL4 n=1 Tax=Leeia speluncae TaxID=2884804 RepID=A0ABS8D6C1_9NEIS|nr:50S ribosomal protein L4 [Leeia speluncae]MCB6183749.1 50S ribosomal protein L4 [Leeia speluncae]